MTILHIIQCTNLGGMERVALSQTRGLIARGHTVRWISLNPLGPLKPLLEEAGIPCVGLPYRKPWGLLSIPAMAAAFRQFPADAVIMTGPNMAGMLALRPRGDQRRLLAVHYHHTGVKPLWQWRLMYAMAVRRFHVITFPSDFIRREAEAIYPGLARQSRTVRNPISVPPLPSLSERTEARRRLGLPLEGKVVGNAGWLIPRKRFDIFLRVSALVAQQIPNAVFIIAGDGPERAPLTALARELGLEPKLHWLGWMSDLTDFYLSLDVLLFNSDWDAFPTTPLEAMSFGVPVVASVKHGGLCEVISSPRCGFLLREHDLAALAGAVVTLLKHPGSMGFAGRERVSEMLNPEKCVSELLEELEGASA